MAHYQPKFFFRRVPKPLLQRYFQKRDLLGDFDWELPHKGFVEALHEAYVALPNEVRQSIDQDFQEIHSLASESGTKTILEWAEHQQTPLAELFAAMESFHERAFWAFLEHLDWWPAVLGLHHADTLPNSYWRKNNRMPRLAAQTDKANLHVLADYIGQYFQKRQGRGLQCEVNHLRRGELDYFFAYPEDYAQASVEWTPEGLQRRPHNPAFETIFVYSQQDGTLDIYLSGDRRPVQDLQVLFARAILSQEITPSLDKDDRVYDLDLLLSRDFQFDYSVSDGIAEMKIIKMKLGASDVCQELMLGVAATKGPQAIFDALDKVAPHIPHRQRRLKSVSIHVAFVQDPTRRNNRSRTFSLAAPNSCSLKYDERGVVIRNVLVRSGIEPRLVAPSDDLNPGMEYAL